MGQGTFKAVSIDGHGNTIVTTDGQGAVREGNVFVAQIGSASTAISFAKTAFDLNQPQMTFDVLAGTTMEMLSFTVVLETEAGALNEIILSTSNALSGVGSSTAVTPVNAKLSASGSDSTSTGVTVRSLYTGDCTDPSSGYEFGRYSQPFVSSDGDPLSMWKWSAAEEGWGPVIEGTGSVFCHIVGATAPTGYVIAVYRSYET